MTRPVPLARYRTIGILANQDAGRTTTAERLLVVAGDVRPAHEASGPDHDRAITLTTAATTCLWGDCLINLVTLVPADRNQPPGPLSVLDGTVLVIDATRSPAASLGAALAQSAGLARIAFVNKLDAAGTDLTAVLGQLAAIPGAPRALALQLPIGTLDGLIDLVSMRAFVWSAADAAPQASPIPAAWLEAAMAARAALVAGVLPGRSDVAEAELADAIRTATLTGTILPVLAGSAFRNRGIAALLDAIAAYLPSPADRTVPVTGAADEAPFVARCFRVVTEAAGPLHFLRVDAGTLAPGAAVRNASGGLAERIGTVLRIHANHTEALDLARTGDIVAVDGLLHTTAGDTLCDPAVPVVLEQAPAPARRA